MKEFNYIFKDGLAKGLRQQKFNPLNEQSLITLHNAKVGAQGIEYFTKIPRLAQISSWPFPQILLGSDFAFYCDETAVFAIPFASLEEDLTVALEALEDENDTDMLDELGEALLAYPFERIAVSAGSAWSLADFGPYALLTNGVSMVQLDAYTNLGSPDLSTKSTDSTFPLCGSFCNFKGQLIGGCVKSSWHDCDETSIIWAKIGTIDFTPTVSGEAGYKSLTEFPGYVHKVMQLGDVVVVYGAGGILSMIPQEEKFGFKSLLSIGIPSISAVAGDEYEQVCVDNLYRLHRFTPEGHKLLDYQEYLSDMTLANIVVSKDTNKGDYYISDGVYGFLLTAKGLSSIYQTPTSVIRIAGSLFGVLGITSEGGFILETDALDFGLRGYKTITTVEAGISIERDIYGKIAWRNSHRDSFKYAPRKLLNPNGIFYPNVTANEMRIRLECDHFSNISLDYFNIKLNLTDKRAVRGRLNVN